MIDDTPISMQDLQKVLPLMSEAEKIKLLAELDKLEELRMRKRRQTHFLDFVRAVWPTFISGRHHKIVAEAFERVANGECKRLIICMPPRHALALDTLVPTTEGFKTIQDIAVGDYVFGPDGVPTQVIDKSDVFHDRELFEVTTSDGASVVVDAEHLWTVRLDRRRKKFHTYTTEQLWYRQQGYVLKTKCNGEAWHPMVDTMRAEIRPPMLPNVEPVQYPEKELPVDPYVLGVWIGDGTSKGARVAAHPDDAKYLRAEIERRGYQTTDHSSPYHFGVLGLQAQLKELGVLGNKHIPDAYLTASVSQRRDLLKGLMDTDGTVTKTGQCIFCQSNYHITLQVAELVRSLGIKAYVTSREAVYKGKSYGETWRLTFTSCDISTLPRKESRTLKTPPKRGRTINVTRLGVRGAVQCIKVNREDGLFLAGDGYICTHNTKSEFASYLFPAWFLGRHPHKKVIQASNTSELAVGFGRKVRNLMEQEQYQEVFPGVELRADSKAAGRWNTNKDGDYYAIGVGGTMTGRGSDLMIIDDPHSEAEAVTAETNPEVYDKVYEWYTSGPRQRLQPNGAIVVVMTRWSKRDLVGQILKSAAQRGTEEWEVIEFPAILPSGKSLWPEFWSLEELDKLRKELPNAKWMAQYQQQPTSDSAAIIKREWWKLWDKDDPPQCEFVVQAWDTAFEKNNRADYSACTTWGVFYQPGPDGRDQANIILLNAIRDRMEFPELKKVAVKQYKDWSPDSLIVEKKASGAPLIYEMRAMGIPVQEFTPSKGNDKISRLNAVSDLFASGVVWYPNKHWAEEVIEEVASFPAGDHDDYVDSLSLALARFRNGGFIRLPSDEQPEVEYFKGHRKGGYY